MRATRWLSQIWLWDWDREPLLTALDRPTGPGWVPPGSHGIHPPGRRPAPRPRARGRRVGPSTPTPSGPAANGGAIRRLGGGALCTWASGVNLVDDCLEGRMRIAQRLETVVRSCKTDRVLRVSGDIEGVWSRCPRCS